MLERTSALQPPQVAVPRRSTDAAGSLARRASVTPGAQLRVGWLWLTGMHNGQPVHAPIVSWSAQKGQAPSLKYARLGLVLTVHSAARLELDITDVATREHLESTIQYGGGALTTVTPGGLGMVDSSSDPHTVDPALLARLTRLNTWVADVTFAAGLGRRQLLARPRNPTQLEVTAELKLYVEEPTPLTPTVGATLQLWHSRPIDNTAFAALYSPQRYHFRQGYRSEFADDHTGSLVSSTWPESPVALTAQQWAAAQKPGTEPITVITGPPGNGKSQTTVAAALHAIEQGHSVLIAAPSTAAVDALVELFDAAPGPDPVVFGGDRQRHVGDDMVAATARAATPSNGATAAARLDHARLAVEQLRLAIHDALEAETDIERSLLAHNTSVDFGTGGVDNLDVLAGTGAGSAHSPQLAGPLLNGLAAAVARARSLRGPLATWRARRHLQRASRTAGYELRASEPRDACAELDAAISLARRTERVAAIRREGGLSLTQSWVQLVAAEERYRTEHGAWLQHYARSLELSEKSRAVVSATAAALRSGRAARRTALARLDGHALAAALPLWVGTLRDIDDLLPLAPAMFDVALIDEASQVDQITAAPALLRAKRLVAIGDPQQLRHVSFVPGDAVTAALDAESIHDPTLRSLLDQRRTSLLDLAVARAAPMPLTQHFRSAPHLIDFSLQRFYEGSTVATTHPRNHSRDCIHVVRVDPAAAGPGRDPQQAEIAAALDLVRLALATAQATNTETSIGIVTPFRALADELRDYVTAQFTLEELELIGLRVGTVHGFQGCERDHMILVLGIAPDAPIGTRTSSPSRTCST